MEAARYVCGVCSVGWGRGQRVCGLGLIWISCLLTHRLQGKGQGWPNELRLQLWPLFKVMSKGVGGVVSAGGGGVEREDVTPGNLRQLSRSGSSRK